MTVSQTKVFEGQIYFTVLLMTVIDKQFYKKVRRQTNIQNK